jgi:DNA polymerase III subunit delta'
MKNTSSFSDFEGNSQLTSLLRKGTLPQSLLFSGPDGVGKKTLAQLLAALGNCKGKIPGQDDLCGKCSSCIKALSGNHPDIYLYSTISRDGTKGASIKIEDMRNLRKEAHYRPFEGSLRFFIIDEAEKMTEEAANCILKVLEEPPPTTRIILITAFPGKLLPTILSRCQSFRFRSLPADSIVRLLESKTDLDRVELRAAFAKGSFGRALNLDLDTIRIKRDAVLHLLSSFLLDKTFTTVFKACQEEQFKKMLKTRASVEELLQLLTTLCHDVYSLETQSQERITNQDCMKQLKNLSGKLPLDSLQKILYHIRQAENDLARNVSPQICFETLWLSFKDID